MAKINEVVVRPLIDFPPEIWGDRFSSLPFNISDFESYSRQVEALKETMKDMLKATGDPVEKMHLINSLYRLGVSYHLEKEIEDDLEHLFILLPKLIDDNHYDLYTVAVIFQVFRLHGFKMLCDVFSKFQDGDGKFKEEVIGNVKGMISLYEASHFRMNGEVILDEALAFTKKHLESLANQASPHLREYIRNALFHPYHYGMQRIEARQYICFYEKDESRNDVLLNFAKYDFNRVQLLHQQEISSISSWYKELNMKSRFPYARHRVVEGFLYALTLSYEPCYARGRIILTKLATLIGFLDDTYEGYALYEELQYFTDATQRFDVSAMYELPTDYQKILYETILRVHDEAENEVRNEGRSYSVSYARDEWKKFVMSEQVEAGWRHEGIFPTFDEYLENGAYSSSAVLGLTHAFIGVEEADKHVYEWAININNKFPRALQICTRLYNDIVSDEDEEKGGLLVTGTACYMKQYNVSREEAIKAFGEEIAARWKDVNESCMRPTAVPMQIIRLALNFQRSLHVSYQGNDNFTKPEIAFKDLITKALLHPIPLT